MARYQVWCHRTASSHFGEGHAPLKDYDGAAVEPIASEYLCSLAVRELERRAGSPNLSYTVKEVA